MGTIEGSRTADAKTKNLRNVSFSLWDNRVISNTDFLFFYYCIFLCPLHSDEVEKISQYMKIRLDFQVNRGRQNKSCNISVCVLQKFRENQFHDIFFYQNPFFASSKMAKNQFLNWGKSLKMQFHEKIFLNISWNWFIWFHEFFVLPGLF